MAMTDHSWLGGPCRGGQRLRELGRHLLGQRLLQTLLRTPSYTCCCPTAPSARGARPARMLPGPCVLAQGLGRSAPQAPASLIAMPFQAPIRSGTALSTKRGSMGGESLAREPLRMHSPAVGLSVIFPICSCVGGGGRPAAPQEPSRGLSDLQGGYKQHDLSALRGAAPETAPAASEFQESPVQLPQNSLGLPPPWGPSVLCIPIVAGVV